MVKEILTDRNAIAVNASMKEEENHSFRNYLQSFDGDELDCIVHELNEKVTIAIDCTKCGACCRSLMINVEQEEIAPLATRLNIDNDRFKEKYIEESLQGQMIMNTIPCHFLSDNKCTVYENRFTECREFPHLHKANFKNRLFGTLIHYAMCPIIYNVIEELKIVTDFTHNSIPAAQEVAGA